MFYKSMEIDLSINQKTQNAKCSQFYVWYDIKFKKEVFLNLTSAVIISVAIYRLKKS